MPYMLKRVLLTTGGTGGHIFPALAVAEELRARHQVKLLFMGSLYGPEKRLAEQAGIEFVGLDVRGVLGHGIKAVQSLAKVLLAMPKALKAVRSFAPDCTAGFGGYASFAPLLASRMLHVPAVLHEQNAVAGVTNRLLARLCASICVSLPGTQGFGARKLTLTGNPVRRCIFAAGKEQRSFDRKHLLVLGGSQGAHALNTMIVELLPALKEAGISLLHQTGTKDYAEVAAAYEQAGMTDSVVSAFVDDMEQAYSWADLGVTRAGASTVAELCGTGLPALLVPYPYAAHDHQMFNARALEKAGACKVFDQKTLAADELKSAILAHISAQDELRAMSKAALSLAQPEAAAKVCAALEACAAS